MQVAKDLLEELHLAKTKSDLDSMLQEMIAREKREEEQKKLDQQRMREHADRVYVLWKIQEHKINEQKAAAAAAQRGGQEAVEEKSSPKHNVAAQTRPAQQTTKRTVSATAERRPFPGFGAGHGGWTSKGKGNERKKQPTGGKAKVAGRAAKEYLDYQPPQKANKAREKSPDPRERIVVIFLPYVARAFDVHQAIVPLRPGALFDYHVVRSTARLEFFNHDSARRLLDRITSEGILIGGTLVKSARIDKAEAEEPDMGFPFRRLCFSAPPGSAGAAYCQTPTAMFALFQKHGFRPGVITNLGSGSVARRSLMLTFMSCRDARKALELLKRAQPDIQVELCPDRMGPGPVPVPVNNETRDERDGPRRDASEESTSNTPSAVLLAVVGAALLVVKQCTEQPAAQAGDEATSAGEALMRLYPAGARPFPARRLADLNKGEESSG